MLKCCLKIHVQGENGIWNVFGGKLAWGPDAIVRDDPNFHGRGNISSGKFRTVFVVVYYIFLQWLTVDARHVLG